MVVNDTWNMINGLITIALLMSEFGENLGKRKLNTKVGTMVLKIVLN